MLAAAAAVLEPRPRNNIASDLFSVIDKPELVPGQKEAFLKLRMKRILADIVHDYGKPFIDANITPIEVLFNYLLNGLRTVRAPTDADILDLEGFYNSCTTDAQAKIHYRFAKQQYLSRYNITEILSEDFGRKTGNEIDEVGNEDDLWNRLRGMGRIKWYIDAQIGNPIKTYEQWRKSNNANGINNILCKDNAIASDPATKWDGQGYLTVEQKDDALHFPGYIIGVGYNCILFRDAGKLYSIWENDDRTEITNYNNSIESLKAQIQMIPAAETSRRVRILLRKQNGDAHQGYTSSSTLWDNTAIEVTNDILEAAGRDDYRTRRVILTTPTELKYTNYDAELPVNLTAEQAVKVRRFWGVGIENQLAAIDVQVQGYFQAIIDGMRNDLSPRYVMRRIAGAPIDENIVVPPHLGEYSINIHDGHYAYVVKFQAPGGDKAVMANVTGSLIDLIEKCYLYELYLNKVAEIRALLPPPAAGNITQKYSIFENSITLRQYLGVYSMYKPKVHQKKIDSIFSTTISFIAKDALFMQLIHIMKQYITVPNVPYNLINLFIVATTLQVTMPTRVPRGSIRNQPISRADIINNDINRRQGWIESFYKNPLTHPFIRTILLLYVTGTVQIGAARSILKGGRCFLETGEIRSAYDLGDPVLSTAIFNGAEFWPTIASEAAIQGKPAIGMSAFEPFITSILIKLFTYIPPVFVLPVPVGTPENTAIIIGRERAIPVSGMPDIPSVEDFIVKLHTTSPEEIEESKDLKDIIEKITPPAVLSHYLSNKKSRPGRKISLDKSSNTYVKVLNGSGINFKKEIYNVFKDGQPTFLQLKRILLRYSSIDPRTMARELNSILTTLEKEIIDFNRNKYFKISTGSILLLLQGGGAHVDPNENSEEQDTYRPSGLDSMISAISKLYMSFEGEEKEIDIHTFQNVVSDLVYATIAVDTDPSAYRIYAISAVSEFNALRDPNDIIAGFNQLKEDEYISNGFWETVPYYNVLDELAAEFAAMAPSWVLDTKEDQLDVFNTILTELTIDKETVGEQVAILNKYISYLTNLKDNLINLPEYNRLYTLTPDDMRNAIDSKITEINAIVQSSTHTFESIQALSEEEQQAYISKLTHKEFTELIKPIPSNQAPLRWLLVRIWNKLHPPTIKPSPILTSKAGPGYTRPMTISNIKQNAPTAGATIVYSSTGSNRLRQGGGARRTRRRANRRRTRKANAAAAARRRRTIRRRK